MRLFLDSCWDMKLGMFPPHSLTSSSITNVIAAIDSSKDSSMSRVSVAMKTWSYP